MKRKVHAGVVILRVRQIFLSLLRHISAKTSWPVYWRTVIEEMGGGIVKLAQILALRYEILPPRYRKEFANLFDHLKPFSKEDLLAVFREEFGKGPEEIFQEFSYNPYACASFGQVHIALLSGRKVAVKVQKPHVQRLACVDIVLLKALMWAGSIFFLTPVNLRDATREWEVWTLRELDYRFEAQKAISLRALHFAHSELGSYCYIPEVFSEYCTSRVAVFEFLEGWSLNDIIHRRTLELSDVMRERISSCVVQTQMLQYILGGSYQADPHPGNIILLEDGRIGYIDFGITGEVGNAQEQYHFVHFIKGAAEGNMKGVVAHFKSMTMGDAFSRETLKGLKYTWRKKSLQKIEKASMRFLEHKLGGIIERWTADVANTQEGFYSRSTARHFISFISMARRYGLEVPLGILSFIRAVIIADTVCLAINPQFNMQKELRHFFIQRAQLLATSLQDPSLSAKTGPIATAGSLQESEGKREREVEERQRLVERYLSYAERIVESIVEEGSRGLAYFATTKI